MTLLHDVTKALSNVLLLTNMSILLFAFYWVNFECEEKTNGVDSTDACLDTWAYTTHTTFLPSDPTDANAHHKLGRAAFMLLTLTLPIYIVILISQVVFALEESHLMMVQKGIAQFASVAILNVNVPFLGKLLGKEVILGAVVSILSYIINFCMLGFTIFWVDFECKGTTDQCIDAWVYTLKDADTAGTTHRDGRVAFLFVTMSLMLYVVAVIMEVMVGLQSEKKQKYLFTMLAISVSIFVLTTVSFSLYRELRADNLEDTSGQQIMGIAWALTIFPTARHTYYWVEKLEISLNSFTNVNKRVDDIKTTKPIENVTAVLVLIVFLFTTIAFVLYQTIRVYDGSDALSLDGMREGQNIVIVMFTALIVPCIHYSYAAMRPNTKYTPSIRTKDEESYPMMGVDHFVSTNHTIRSSGCDYA